MSNPRNVYKEWRDVKDTVVLGGARLLADIPKSVYLAPQAMLIDKVSQSLFNTPIVKSGVDSIENAIYKSANHLLSDEAIAEQKAYTQATNDMGSLDWIKNSPELMKQFPRATSGEILSNVIPLGRFSKLSKFTNPTAITLHHYGRNSLGSNAIAKTKHLLAKKPQLDWGGQQLIGEQLEPLYEPNTR